MKKYLIIFLLGCVFSAILYFWLFSSSEGPKIGQRGATYEETQIIAHEIKRLNKMIVIEQNFSEFYTHENSRFGDNAIGRFFEIDDKKVVLLVKARAQVTYDMKQLKVDIDSANKTIHLKYIPEPKIEVFPDVQVYHLTQHTLNRYSEHELKDIVQKAKNKITEVAMHSGIEENAKNQLMENLNDLFFVAKIYNWKIVDDKGLIKNSQQSTPTPTTSEN